jgi:glycerol-3-phosphate dehydrogenase
MALTLRDIVLRRTDIGTAGLPDESTLSACAKIAAAELGWSPERTDREIALVSGSYPFATPASQLYAGAR